MEKRPLPHAYYRAKKYHLNINRILNFHQYGIGITWHALPEITICNTCTPAPPPLKYPNLTYAMHTC